MLPVFAQPWWLLLFLVPIGFAVWRRRRPVVEPSVVLPTWAAATATRPTWRVRVRPYLGTLKWVACSLLILAMARPQWVWSEERIKAEAVDIMLSLDISLSMLTRDFVPNRIEVAKQMASDFVGRRKNDRIGLVAFAGEAFTHCPLTTDGKIVQRFLKELAPGAIEPGTAIGLGLATAVQRLKDSKAKSKIIIMLTDGRSNLGFVSPQTAMDLAKTFQIKVYTIGIGSEGLVETPYTRDQQGNIYYKMEQSEYDFGLLRQIADHTGGKFFRARSSDDLAEVYDIIDGLEKTQIEINTIQHETDLYQWLLVPALMLLLLELLLRYVFLRTI
jgi:Ca-activated chloride channel homolog